MQSQYTIDDIIDELRRSRISVESVQKLARLLEKEWYLVEDRFGGCYTVSSELHGFLTFLRERFIPLLRSDFEVTHEKTSVEILDDYVKGLSEETLDWNITHASARSVKIHLATLATGKTVT